uniref:Uncharacterized protein n=1 Tax=Magallana gigas TaxID=29159 RepID=K1PCC2_MAGGI
MLRRPKTGGGPAPPSLTASEDALMQAFDGRPQICGLADGIDTDANDETTETSKDVESITLAPGTTSSTSSTSKPSASTSSSLSERPTASKKSKRKQMKDVLEEEEVEAEFCTQLCLVAAGPGLIVTTYKVFIPDELTPFVKTELIALHLKRSTRGRIHLSSKNGG